MFATFASNFKAMYWGECGQVLGKGPSAHLFWVEQGS
jgi:hypothetical protein